MAFEINFVNNKLFGAVVRKKSVGKHATETTAENF